MNKNIEVLKSWLCVMKRNREEFASDKEAWIQPVECERLIAKDDEKIAALTAAIADMERMEWLESQNIVELKKQAFSNAWSVDSIQTDDYKHPKVTIGGLREAIDAAMKEGETK